MTESLSLAEFLKRSWLRYAKGGSTTQDDDTWKQIAADLIEDNRVVDTSRFSAETQAGTQEGLGQLVRQVWVDWAMHQPDAKPSWLLGWDELDAGQKEVDIRIGSALFDLGRRFTEPHIIPPMSELRDQIAERIYTYDHETDHAGRSWVETSTSVRVTYQEMADAALPVFAPMVGRLNEAFEALRALSKACIAVETTLTRPYPDHPETNPWKQFVESPARRAYNLSVQLSRELFR